MDDYTAPHEIPDGKRFAVVRPGLYGPDVSFWADMENVIGLLAGYINNQCGSGVTVWYRRTARSAWKLLR